MSEPTLTLRGGRGRYVDGQAVRLRDFEWRSLVWLVRHRRANVTRYVRCIVARALALPGDRFYNLVRDREGEVVAVKRDHVVMRTLTGEQRLRRRLGVPVVEHFERIPRDDFGWWEPA